MDTDTPFKLILGSSSPARRDILAEMGYHFTVMNPEIDEKVIRIEKPEDLVMALAQAKAEAIKGKLHAKCLSKKEEEGEPTLLITSDQVMVNRGMIREKPIDEEEAQEFIKGYSGNFATAVGYVLVTNLKTGFQRGGWDKPQIHFYEIPDEVIERVVREIINVAGGFRMEHPLAAPYVKEVIGAMDSVMGLPKQLTKRLLQEALEETCA
ncbi:maf-like protein [Carex littledalei]|uniref:Maf-like protein n=1 Tax=Carex littledalei TaxID=544730 RepID=A0A833QC98_9POAL|nr:maf-like protein [Carex littledalei]